MGIIIIILIKETQLKSKECVEDRWTCGEKEKIGGFKLGLAKHGWRS